MAITSAAVTGSGLAAARAGDMAAFERLLEPLLLPGFKLAMVMLRRQEDSEDAVQEAAIKAWRRLRQFRGEDSAFRAWFLSIVVNQCRMAMRGRWWSVLRLPELGGSDRWAEDAQIAGVDLRRALERMGPDQRLPLYLHFHLDLSVEEVGRVLGVPAATAKTRIYRAARSLRPGLALEEELL